MNTTTAEVRTDLIYELEKRIERKINRPARKLHLAEAVVEYGEAYPRFYVREEVQYGFETADYIWSEIDADTKVKRDEQGKRVFIIEFTPVSITADEARLAGWKFIATIEHTEAGNILRSATDTNQDLPIEYRTNTNVCDHCKTNRRRKDTYIVQNDAFGELRQVGRTCIKDFLGHGDPEALARYFDNILSLWSDLAVVRDDDEYFVSAPLVESTDTFLSVVAESIRVNGWVAKSAWEGYPTAQLAWSYLTDLNPDCAKRVKDYGFNCVTADSITLANDARNWIASAKVESDYLHNLKTACTLDSVTGRRAGLVASVITAYQRYLGDVEYKKAEKNRKAEAGPVPVTDERIEITGTVVSAKWRTSDWGSSLKLTVQTEAGYRVWGSAPSALFSDGDPAPGDVVTFTAKVSVSENDASFGFYSRPTKAVYVSRAEVAGE